MIRHDQICGGAFAVICDGQIIFLRGVVYLFPADLIFLCREWRENALPPFPRDCPASGILHSVERGETADEEQQDDNACFS